MNEPNPFVADDGIAVGTPEDLARASILLAPRQKHDFRAHGKQTVC